MTRTVGVLGTGSFGTVITGLLVEKGSRVIVWDKDAEAVRTLARDGENPRYQPGYRMNGRPEAAGTLEGLCRECDIIFSVLPAKAVRSVASEVGDHVGTDKIIVSCTKGLEFETLKRMTEVIREETPLRKIGALSGPNLAGEIAGRSPSSAVIASELDEVIEEVHAVLNSDFFRVFGSHDPAGVEFCGSLKNVYAIASGAADGLGYGMNARAFLLTKALKEMEYFSVRFGARRETFSGIAGAGDLMATAMSELSRNFRFGRLIAGGSEPADALAQIGRTVEGYHTVEALVRFAGMHGLRLPIAEAVYCVVYDRMPIDGAVERLLRIKVLFEDELYR